MKETFHRHNADNMKLGYIVFWSKYNIIISFEQFQGLSN